MIFCITSKRWHSYFKSINCCMCRKKVAGDQWFCEIADRNEFPESIFSADTVAEGFRYGKLTYAATSISHFIFYSKNLLNLMAYLIWFITFWFISFTLRLRKWTVMLLTKLLTKLAYFIMVLTWAAFEKLNKEELLSLFVENDDNPVYTGLKLIVHKTFNVLPLSTEKLKSNFANLKNQLAKVNKTLEREESQLQISKTINNTLKKGTIFSAWMGRNCWDSWIN